MHVKKVGIAELTLFRYTFPRHVSTSRENFCLSQTLYKYGMDVTTEESWLRRFINYGTHYRFTRAHARALMRALYNGSVPEIKGRLLHLILIRRTARVPNALQEYCIKLACGWLRLVEEDGVRGDELDAAVSLMALRLARPYEVTDPEIADLSRAVANTLSRRLGATRRAERPAKAPKIYVTDAEVRDAVDDFVRKL